MPTKPEDPDKKAELAKAYDELAEAIKKVIELNDWNVSIVPEDERAPMMLGDYVVLAAQQGYDRDGDGISSLAMITPNGQLPWHRLIGLIHEGRVRVEHEYVRED